MRLGLTPPQALGSTTAPGPPRGWKGGSCYSRLGQPGTQDISASKSWKRCAAVETCLWVFLFVFAQGSRGCLKREKDDLDKFSEGHTPRLSARCLFPAHAGLLTDITHTGIGTVGRGSSPASAEDRTFSQPLISWHEMGQDGFLLLPSLGTEGTHKQTPLPPLSQAKATLVTG